MFKKRNKLQSKDGDSCKRIREVSKEPTDVEFEVDLGDELVLNQDKQKLKRQLEIETALKNAEVDEQNDWEERLLARGQSGMSVLSHKFPEVSELGPDSLEQMIDEQLEQVASRKRQVSMQREVLLRQLADAKIKNGSSDK